MVPSPFPDARGWQYFVAVVLTLSLAPVTYAACFLLSLAVWLVVVVIAAYATGGSWPAG